MKSNYISIQPNNQNHFNPDEYKTPDLTKKDIIDLKEVFDEMDMDGNGLVSPIELRAALCNFGRLNANMETVHHIILEYDKDLQGELSFKDFLEIAREDPESKELQEKRTREIINMFREYDVANKGYLEVGDLVLKAKGLGENLREEEAKEIFEKCSSDGKSITVEDFYRVMNYGYDK